MTAAERDAFLREERTCRVATVGSSGAPHVTPLWYVWDGDALWLYSIVRSRRWADLARDPRVSVVVDAGVEFFELRGVELRGEVEMVGEQPRTGTPDAALGECELLFARRYLGGDTMLHDGRHAWLRLRPGSSVSWDFRKSPLRPA